MWNEIVSYCSFLPVMVVQTGANSTKRLSWRVSLVLVERTAKAMLKLKLLKSIGLVPILA